MSKSKGKEHIIEDPESYPSLSDSSLSEFDSSNDRKCSKYRNKNESDSSNDIKYGKSKIKKRDKKEKASNMHKTGLVRLT